MKILMVCLGNICRSPMAEGIMREKGKKYGLNIEVDSAGFEPFHAGDAPDYRAQSVMNKQGIDISDLRSRVFKQQDFDKFDHIYVMDRGNYRDVQNAARNAKNMEKVDFIMNVLQPGSNSPVPDPYYGNLNEFEKTYQLLDKAAEQIAQNLLQQLK